MKAQLVLLFGLIFLSFGCEDEEMDFSLCEDNPIENVTWIKELIAKQELIDENNTLKIIQYNYKGNTVFSVDRCPYNCSDSLIEVYDCEQNLICEFGGIAGLDTCPGFDNESIDQGVVFSNVKKEIQESRIEKITFQNSFGSCLGYCIKSIKIEEKKLVFTSEDRSEELETIICEFNLDDDQWEALQNDLDVDQFLGLDDVFGCPDCADGGASFIEIETTNGETKKVTFEYKKSPSIIEEYAEILQTLLEGSNNCEEVPVEQGCDKSVVVNNEVYNALPFSPIESVDIVGNCMQITFSLLSTQNPLEDVVLVDSGLVQESFPIQRSLKLHINESLTKPTIVKDILSFDISDLATWDAPEAILNIEGYDKQIKFVRKPQCGDPNVTCPPRTQEQDLKEQGFMLDELKVISSIVTCENSENIIAAPVGDKACGGPQLFLPYNSSIDVNEFLSKIEIYTKAEKAFNIKWGVNSTCEITPAPIYNCVDGKPLAL